MWLEYYPEASPESGIIRKPIKQKFGSNGEVEGQICKMISAGHSVTAKGALVGVGLIFVASGLMVGGLRLAQSIPPSYGWLAPLFLALGAVGSLTAWFGLRKGRRWPLVIIALLYVPWTIVGLLGDAKQEYWPLVAAELLGLVLVVWAIATITRRAV